MDPGLTIHGGVNLAARLKLSGGGTWIDGRDTETFG
jgi:hypothetical protein